MENGANFTPATNPSTKFKGVSQMWYRYRNTNTTQSKQSTRPKICVPLIILGGLSIALAPTLLQGVKRLTGHPTASSDSGLEHPSPVRSTSTTLTGVSLSHLLATRLTLTMVHCNATLSETHCKLFFLVPLPRTSSDG